MARRIYIIPKSIKVEDALEDARVANCAEIVQGIPSILQDIISEQQLPTVYEEPEPIPPEPPCSTYISILEAVDATKARPATVRRRWEGKDYYYKCFVTQAVKDEFVEGKINIGDYLLVHFDEIGEQIVTAKVFKSW